ncbi:hypothetical protein GGX14DRAFT_392478 [Mycena pura]|uniref:Uncharacterized protein n=1 Tax=Mycena pura TaxID=153505 RepID=A0AAD6YFN5_9AGAR|nr:hypothetical protein GGX14DRAFT_392478 [Mycena pura]
MNAFESKNLLKRGELQRIGPGEIDIFRVYTLVEPNPARALLIEVEDIHREGTRLLELNEHADSSKTEGKGQLRTRKPYPYSAVIACSYPSRRVAAVTGSVGIPGHVKLPVTVRQWTRRSLEVAAGGIRKKKGVRAVTVDVTLPVRALPRDGRKLTNRFPPSAERSVREVAHLFEYLPRSRALLNVAPEDLNPIQKTIWTTVCVFRGQLCPPKTLLPASTANDLLLQLANMWNFKRKYPFKKGHTTESDGQGETRHESHGNKMYDWATREAKHIGGVIYAKLSNAVLAVWAN